MSVARWVGGYVVDLVLSLWILRWGGAQWLEGTFSSGLVISWLASRWTAEGIRAFVLLSFVLTAIWFVVGLFVPEARGL